MVRSKALPTSDQLKIGLVKLQRELQGNPYPVMAQFYHRSLVPKKLTQKWLQILLQRPLFESDAQELTGSSKHAI
jgi:hypothetical protein